jgi:Family of unknown function (DUF6252)
MRILSALLTLFVAIGFTGCQTEPVDPAVLDNEPIDVPGDASFTVQFGGQTFEADATQAVIEGGLITVGGMRGTNGETVAFVLAGNQEGTYNAANLDEGGLLFSYTPTASSEYTYNNFNDDGSSLNGVVEITEIDEVNHTISGTFSFTGYYGDSGANLPSVAFTNGQFTDIPYETDVINPGEDGEYFNATIDGEDWEFDIFAAADSGSYITVSANDFASGTQVSVTMPANITPGTYAITDDFTEGPSAILGMNDDVYSSPSGTLTITANDGDFIVGTFSFAAVNGDDQTVPVTNGEFSIELP